MMKKLLCILVCCAMLSGTLMGCNTEPEASDTSSGISSDTSSSVSSETASETSSQASAATSSELAPAPDPTATDRGLYQEGGGLAAITLNGLTCEVDTSTGLIRSIATAEQRLELNALLIDVGVNQENVFRQLACTDLTKNETWTLPSVYVRKNDLPPYTVNYIRQTDAGLDVSFLIQSLEVVYHYEFLPTGLRLSCTISTSSTEPLDISGVGFIVQGMNLPQETTTYEFPGNTPGGVHSVADSLNYSVMSTDYCNGVTCFKNGTESVNIIFLDDQEKWGCAFYKGDENRPCLVNLAAVESYLSAGESLEVGRLFVQLPGSTDAYQAVQDYYVECGYHTPENSVNDGPIYSCHPAGTMDTGFQSGTKLQDLAEYLDELQAMGFKNIWLLPIFQDTGNPYEAIDQSVISEFYGGEEGAKLFADTAHSLGLRVLYDYVPHGPRPIYALAKDNPDWCSMTKFGTKQIEWECVSFDYNNPDYQEYTTNLVMQQALELGVDGARIDCAMGGLSNWNPQEGLRPSASGLHAGIEITKAIRQGFLDAGKQPFLLPENFHPIPLYAEYTDVFYDMPLYRFMNGLNYSLNSLEIDDAEYVSMLQQWLDAERRTSVPGQVKMRFLENHDTCHWTFDAARAQVVYGLEKSQAMFAFISFIDGVPYVYQGDEAPEDYREAAKYGTTNPNTLEFVNNGVNQEEFFTELFRARADFLPQDYDIEYISTGTPVFAFYRFSDTDRKLVLINFSEEPQTYTQEGGSLLYAHSASLDGSSITLDSYGFAIVQL